MGEKRFIFYENIGSAANFLVFLEEFLLLFKKFNRVFFSPFMIAKSFVLFYKKFKMLLLLFIIILIIVLHDNIQPECSSHKGVCLKNKMKKVSLSINYLKINHFKLLFNLLGIFHILLYCFNSGYGSKATWV